jgi:hypothetical protein
MTAYPEVGIVCSDWRLIDDEGRTVGVRRHRVKPVMPLTRYDGPMQPTGSL